MTDGGTVYLETGFPYESARKLTKMAHAIHYNVGSLGSYQAIRYDVNRHVYYGESESPKDGPATGY